MTWTADKATSRSEADGSGEQTLSIDARFRGLPGLAQGGYTSGLVAASLGSRGAEVRLRRPVAVDRPLTIRSTGTGRAELLEGETRLSEAASADLSIDTPEAPTAEAAEAASRRFPGLEHHPCPECYVCGTDRLPGDGLLIRPGPVVGQRLVATVWTPDVDPGSRHDEAPVEDVWAAFDCAQLWALIVHQSSRPGERVVTSQLAANVDRPVVAGTPHVLVAWPIGRSGESFKAGAALFDPDGRLCASGVQTAVGAKWGVPLDLAA